MSNVRSGSKYIPVSGAQLKADLASKRQLYQDSDDFPLPPGGFNGGGTMNFIPGASDHSSTVAPTVAPGPAFDLISSIKELQSLEEYLFSQLQAVNQETPQDTTQQNDIISHINQLSDLRNDLFGQLGKIYVNLDKNSQVQRSALTDQLTTANMMEQQMNNLKNDVQIILDERVNKMRMVKIGEYEYLRYSAHKVAMQIIAFTSLAILFFSYSLKKNILPPALSKVGIMASVSIGGVLTVRALWYMVTRDNQNYNRFREPELDAMLNEDSESVWQHDVNFFEKLWRGIKAEEKKDWKELKHKWNQSAAGQLEHQAEMMKRCLLMNNPKLPKGQGGRSGDYCYNPQVNGCVLRNSGPGNACLSAGSPF